MKLLICSVLAAAGLVSTTALAQPSASSVTHAQLMHELALLEQAGYQPLRRNANYPEDLQAAQARVLAQHGLPPGPAPAGQ